VSDKKVLVKVVDGRVGPIMVSTPEKSFHPAFPWDEFPPMAQLPGVEYADVSGLDPQPTSGWTYDGETFSPPVEPELTPEEAAERNRKVALAELAATDLPMIRALEDLIGVLIAKGVIADTDLPSAVNTKLQSRAALRAALWA
jgi:hypothetical protein